MFKHITPKHEIIIYPGAEWETNHLSCLKPIPLSALALTNPDKIHYGVFRYLMKIPLPWAKVSAVIRMITWK